MWQTALTASLALIEPAILIRDGLVVVFILISLYLPIFSLGSAAPRGPQGAACGKDFMADSNSTAHSR